MSPRAAWRLDGLGFTDVYDYAAGKADWLARGEPSEGRRSSVPRVGAHARTNVPTCSLDEQVGVVAERIQQAGWDTCIVTNDQGVVLGRVYGSRLAGDPSATVEEAMRSGPSTFRPDVSVEEIERFLGERDLTTALVTTSEGRLIGLYRRDERSED